MKQKDDVRVLNSVDGNLYENKYFTDEDVVKNILPICFGLTCKYITYEQLSVVTTMLNHSWTLIPGFYGEKTNNGVILKPNVGWFSLTMRDINKENVIHQYTAYINFSKLEILLYNKERLVATFYNLEDLFEYMPQLNNGIPLTYVGYNDEHLNEKINAFTCYNNSEFDGIEYYPNRLVYEDMDVKNFQFTVDTNKCSIVECYDENTL